MTNRRSLQTGAARQSRQTQFVPGHVGGRVASAQPVRSRRTIGATATPPPVLPTSAVVRGVIGGDAIDLTAAPADSRTAIALVAAFASIWTPGMKNLVAPAGWRVVATAAWNVEVSWWVLVADSPATAAHYFTWTDDGVDQVQTMATATYLTGGSGGNWGVTLGTPNYDTPISTPTPPPAGAQVWQQVGLISSLWVGAGGAPSYTIGSGAYISIYSYPQHGTYDSTQFLTQWVNGTPTTTDLTWSSFGAYGQSGSQPMCFTFG